MLYTGSSCSKDDESSSGESLISATNGNKSHNAGQNCMNCHVTGGQGEGSFVAAGTVYSSATTVSPNSVITLSTGANGTGTVKATLYGDAKGNFYTTAPIDFSGGLYPSVKNTAGASRYMSSSITQAACNGCHSSSNNRIFVP
jgi:hypothetical protein